jgi:threonine/homoserine/homoserine lactone efflux protein
VTAFSALILGLVVAVPWALSPGSVSRAALARGRRLGLRAGVLSALPRILLDGVMLTLLFLALLPFSESAQVEATVLCIAGGGLCILGTRIAARGRRSRLYRPPRDPNHNEGLLTVFGSGLLGVLRTPSFFIFWLTGGASLAWLAIGSEAPLEILIWMLVGDAMAFLAWCLFLANAARHHRGIRVMDGRAYRAVLSLGGLGLSLLGLYFLVMRVLLGTVLPLWVPRGDLGL